MSSEVCSISGVLRTAPYLSLCSRRRTLRALETLPTAQKILYPIGLACTTMAAPATTLLSLQLRDDFLSVFAGS